MIIRLAFITGLMTLLAAAAVQSQTDKPYFPGESADRSTTRAQDKVEKLYEEGKYKRALLIYEKDLAPAGDKYAQYMVGYMNLTGKSVAVDRTLALAWYKLAAERGHAPLVQARDALANICTEDEIARSNQQFAEMWVTFGDNKLILNLIHEDLKDLRVKTGSRIPGSSTGSLTIVSGRGVGDDYYEKLRLRIERRLEYLDSSVDVIDIGIDEEVAEIKALEMDARAELAALDGS